VSPAVRKPLATGDRPCRGAARRRVGAVRLGRDRRRRERGHAPRAVRAVRDRVAAAASPFGFNGRFIYTRATVTLPG